MLATYRPLRQTSGDGDGRQLANILWADRKNTRFIKKLNKEKTPKGILRQYGERKSNGKIQGGCKEEDELITGTNGWDARRKKISPSDANALAVAATPDGSSFRLVVAPPELERAVAKRTGDIRTYMAAETLDGKTLEVHV